MADQVLTRDGPVAVPMEYQVPQGGELIPLVVNATLDGSAAASDFFGAVQIVAPSGRIMGSAITGSIAAGASASPTWFPGVGDGANSNNPPIPGTILGVYGGQSAAVDFTTNSVVFIQTNFPTNGTFTKVSGSSSLIVLSEGDFTTGGAPDTLFYGVFVDGINFETTGIQISQAGGFATATISTVKGVLGTPLPPIAAGVHTVDVRVACQAGANFTLRTSTSVDLTIIEVVT